MKSWCVLVAAVGFGAAMFHQPISKALTAHGPQFDTLVISGNFNGYLEPCGCTSPMIGGVRRLATLVDGLRSQGPTYFLLAPSAVESASSASKIGLRQNLLKAETVAEFAKLTHADVLGIGPNEASYGSGLILEMAQLAPGIVTDSNLAKTNVPGMQRFVTKGNFMIAVADSQDGASLRFDDSNQVVPTGQVVQDLIFQAKNTGKTPILMLSGSQDLATQIATKNTGLGMIIYQSQGTAQGASQIVNGCWLVSPGDQGRQAIILSFQNGSFQNLRSIPMGPEIPDSKVAGRAMHNYLQRVDQEDLLAMWPKKLTAKFSGPQACLSCHQSDYDVWHASAHAHAYRDLLKQGHGLDPDCVQCHVTGLSSTYGFKSLAKTPRFANVSCESCHGPGQAHVLNPKLVKMTTDPKLCVSCHTHENSSNFDFASYWVKIQHK